MTLTWHQGAGLVIMLFGTLSLLIALSRRETRRAGAVLSAVGLMAASTNYLFPSVNENVRTAIFMLGMAAVIAGSYVTLRARRRSELVR